MSTRETPASGAGASTPASAAGPPNQPRIRVLVADDHAVVREGIRAVLEAANTVEVVAEASTGDEALELARVHEPDVAVLDVSMPGRSGLELASTLRDELTSVRVLMLSMHEKPEYVLGAVRAGAHGYVLKEADPAELLQAVETVHRGEEFFSSRAARQLSAAIREEERQDDEDGRAASLTSREREVLIRVAEGRTSREIADELGISPRTVETHRESIMMKLEIRTVAGLTRFALEAGLLVG